MVYIREAHPVDGWRVRGNDREGIEVEEPRTEEDREEVAGKCAQELKLPMPMLIDDMKNTAQRAYAGWPDRLYIIAKDGSVHYKGGPGPGGFNVPEAKGELEKLLSR